MLWSGLIHSFIHVLGEIAKWTDSGCQRRLYMLMSDLTHSLNPFPCKAHLNMYIENALYKFINSLKHLTTQLKCGPRGRIY